MAKTPGAKTILRKQPPMRRVLLALLPCLAGGIYYFGWRVLATVLFCCVVGFIGEWLFCRKRNVGVTEAVFVTAVLYGLVMPPGLSWHILAIGTLFAVVFSKEVFGGFGKNFFNPALAGRCFVYICFPAALTTTWPLPAQGPTGALTRWSTVTNAEAIDTITTATPMALLKAGRLETVAGKPTHEALPWQISKDDKVSIYHSVLLKDLLLGRMPGTVGVTSALLILIGGVYLYITKTASRTTILSLIISYALLNLVLNLAGVKPVPPPWIALLGGGFLFGAFFMATDPVSSPRTEQGKIIYGCLIALCTVVIRNFSIFNGGLMFAILLGNMFAPIIDYAVNARIKVKKARVREATA
jgi:Na+-transporting NADH:ubiquinone oxidoreductase subunit B